MSVFLVAAGAGNDGYTMLLKCNSLVLLRPVPVVREKAAAKGGLEEGIPPLNVVAIALKLEHESDATVGSEHQMLTKADKPAFQGGTVSFLRHAIESNLLPLAYWTADIHRMGIYDKKGGSSSSSSPAISANAPARRSRSGVRSVLRSAQFCRESLLGKKSHMTWLRSNHS